MAYTNATAVNYSRDNGIDILNYVNEVTNGWASNFTLIAAYFIIAMSIYFYKQDIIEACAISGYVVMAVGLMFWLAGFISGTTFTFVLGVAIAGYILLHITPKGI